MGEQISNRVGDAIVPGETIADRYRVEAVLARGGMGAVYAAHDERLQRPVAIKVLLPALLGDDEIVRRFEREALAAARIAHAGVVQVFDLVRTADGASVLVMERVAGRTLSAILGAEGRLAPARVADLGEQALDALGAAHAAGIVHRDLKPGNVMLVPSGASGREITKVLDFGIAQLKDGAAYSRLTRTGVILGTPTFMAPEQARGERMDARADVYSLGVVLWCALTGTRPFRGADAADTMMQVLERMPPRADELVPDVPRALADVVERAMQKRPDARFESAAAMARAIAAPRASAPAAAPPSQESAWPVAGGHTATSVDLPRDTAASMRAVTAIGAPPTPAAAPAIAAPIAAAPPKERPPWRSPLAIGMAIGCGGIAFGLGALTLALAVGGGLLVPGGGGAAAPGPAPRSSGAPVVAWGASSGSASAACSAARHCCEVFCGVVRAPPTGCEQFEVPNVPADLCQRQAAQYRTWIANAGGDPSACEPVP